MRVSRFSSILLVFSQNLFFEGAVLDTQQNSEESTEIFRIPPASTYPQLPPITNITYQNGTFVTKSELVLTIIIAQSLQFNLGFCGFDKCTIYVHHYNIKQNISTVLKILCSLLIHRPYLSPLEITNFIISTVLPFRKSYLSMSFHSLITHVFSALNNILLLKINLQ